MGSIKAKNAVCCATICPCRFTIDQAFLPATSDQQFADFRAEHPDLFFEMTAEGEIIIMPPNFSLTGIRNGQITSQLERWATADRLRVARRLLDRFRASQWRPALARCIVDPQR